MYDLPRSEKGDYGIAQYFSLAKSFGSETLLSGCLNWGFHGGTGGVGEISGRSSNLQTDGTIGLHDRTAIDSAVGATVFLGRSLKVRRFTEQVTKIIKLIPDDVGRPVTDLAINLLYPELADDARQVLRTLIPIDKSLVSKDGRWFATRLEPNRTFDYRINGVVITFTDMTVVKRLEAELHMRNERPK